MSRPWSSVPNRYLVEPSALQAGGRRASPSSSVARSKGLWGVTQPAKTAQNRHRNAMTAAIIATGELRKLCPTSLSSQRARFFFIRERKDGVYGRKRAGRPKAARHGITA